MDPNFIIVVPSVDAVERLRSSFPSVWPEVLEYAYPDSPTLIYAGLAEILLQHRDDSDLWERAYRFFNEMAATGDASLEYALTGAFERLCDSDMAADVDARLDGAARSLFRKCRL